jgi:hypothetical protein
MCIVEEQESKQDKVFLPTRFAVFDATAVFGPEELEALFAGWAMEIFRHRSGTEVEVRLDVGWLQWTPPRCCG